MTISHDSVTLGKQIAELTVLAAICAWMTRLWIFEEVFRDIQRFLRRRTDELGKKSKEAWQATPRRIGEALLTQVQKRIWFLFHCPTCFVHIPALFFICITKYKLMEPGLLGGFYAWMFTATEADTFMILIAMWKKADRLEGHTTKAVAAAASLLSQKVNLAIDTRAVPPQRMRPSEGRDANTTTSDEGYTMQREQGPTIP